MMLTAFFAIDQYTLTIIVSGGGRVTTNPNNISYSNCETVTLTAMPNKNWAFSGWSGDLTGTTNPETLVMVSNKIVYVSFTRIPKNYAT